MVELKPEDYEDEEKFNDIFQFKVGVPSLLKAKDGRNFVSSLFAFDGNLALPGIFLRPDNDQGRLVFIPWHNILSVESLILVEDE